MSSPQSSSSDPIAPATSSNRSRLPANLFVQIGGFIIGLGLLYWCVTVALTPENQKQLASLQHASITSIIELVLLTLSSLVLNGLIFWATLYPVKKLSPLDLTATNAVASLLAFLPFKLSIIFRFLIHRRRDEVPLLTIGAWFAAVAGGLLMILGPLAALSLWRRAIDAVWMIGAAVSIPLLAIIVISVAKFAAGEVGMLRITRIANRLNIEPISKAVRSGWFGKLHSICAMVGNPYWFGIALALRLMDTVVWALRFHDVSKLLGKPLGWDTSVMISSTYFLAGILVPSGTLGSREAAALALARKLAVPDADSVAVVALVVTAFEAATLLGAAALGLIWLRPDRLLRKR